MVRHRNPTRTPPDMEGWMRIRTVSQPFQADVLKASLESQGYQVLILNKRDSSYGMFGELEVHVPTADAIHASNWLDGLESEGGAE